MGNLPNIDRFRSKKKIKIKTNALLYRALCFSQKVCYLLLDKKIIRSKKLVFLSTNYSMCVCKACISVTKFDLSVKKNSK